MSIVNKTWLREVTDDGFTNHQITHETLAFHTYKHIKGSHLCKEIHCESKLKENNPFSAKRNRMGQSFLLSFGQ